MPDFDVNEITWVVTETGRVDVAEIRKELGEDDYAADVLSLQRLLCGYFSSVAGCASKGLGISPVGATADGGKILKVRWGIRGGGKSGGLRFAFVAYCDRRCVVLCRAFIRKNAPGDEDFDSAAKLAAEYEHAGLQTEED